MRRRNRAEICDTRCRHIRQQQKPAGQRHPSPPDGPAANGTQRLAPAQSARTQQQSVPAQPASSSRVESPPALHVGAAEQSVSEADSDAPSSHEQQDAAAAPAAAEAGSGSSSSSSSSSDDDADDAVGGSASSDDDDETAAASPGAADADDAPGQEGLTDAEKAFWGGASAAAAPAGGSHVQRQGDHAGDWTQPANVLVEMI